MKTTTQSKIDVAKIKANFAKSVDAISDSIKTMHTAMGDASPEQVAEALSEKAIPALESVKDLLEEVEEALPVQGGDEMGLGEEEGGGMGEEEEETDLLGAKNNKHGKSKIEFEQLAKLPEFQTMQNQLASLKSENLTMKKASLAKRWASLYPQQMRKAMEDEFMEDHKEDEDVEKMEAKISAAEKGISAYHVAGLINRSRAPQTSVYLPHTAKNGKARTAKDDNQEIPWYMRQ